VKYTELIKNKSSIIPDLPISTKQNRTKIT